MVPPLENIVAILLYRKLRKFAVLTHFILINPSRDNISFPWKKQRPREIENFFSSRPLSRLVFNPSRKLQFVLGQEKERKADGIRFQKHAFLLKLSNNWICLYTTGSHEDMAILTLIP